MLAEGGSNKWSRSSKADI